MHSLVHPSGRSLLERGWTLSQSGVALDERWQAGVGILYPLGLLPAHWHFPSGLESTGVPEQGVQGCFTWRLLLGDFNALWDSKT